jgi:Brp/Blh family beta-carotene 15,15'-monooxygenase
MKLVKNIHITFLSAFSSLGLVCYALLQNQWIENDISLLIFCLILILTLGVSHGALDHFRGEKILKPIIKGRWFLVFYPGYISLSLFVIICWILFPSISLLIFLLVAGYHFGEEDLSFFKEEQGLIFNMTGFLKGFLIIALSLHFNFETTSTFFNYLMVDITPYSNLRPYTSILFAINLLLLIMGTIYLFKKHLNELVLILLEVILIILSFKYLPLILAFTLYFCFLHSSKHITGLAKELDGDDLINGFRLFTKKAIPLTVLTGIGALGVVFFLNHSLTENIIQTIFIGLASLTLPHILLEVIDKK